MMPIFDSLTPGQRYNPSTSSFEPYNRDTTSILGNNSETAAMMQEYGNTTKVDAGGLLSPLAVVDMVRAYVGMLTAVVSSTILYYILKLFMGEQLAHVVTFILNLMIFIVGVRVLTGRIRWD